MPQVATQVDVSRALGVIKAMDLWGEDWAEPREAGRAAYQDAMNLLMKGERDRWLEQRTLADGPDRRNGYYRRDLLTALGVIELRVARTRTFSAQKIVARFARRRPEVDQAILSGFVLGLSTRKVGVMLRHLMGEAVSA